MLATSMVPAFAAASYSYEAEAQVLNDLGLYNGISETTFNPDLGTALNRETGVVMLLRLFGLEADAKAMTSAEVTAALAKFTDAATISDWAKASVAYAVENALVLGLPDGTFAPKANLVGKAYCTLILRQLGYTPNYDTAAAELADVGGLTTTQAVVFSGKALIKDDLVGISFGTLSAKDSDGATVIANLVAGGAVDETAAVDAGLYAEPTATPTPTPAAIAVDSVTAINARQVVVNFNKDISSTSVTTDTVKAYIGTATTVTSYTFNVSGKVLTLGLSASIPQDTDVKVVVAGVKSAASATDIVASTTKTARMIDVTAPSIISATATSSKTFTIKSSEPLAYAAGTDSYHVLTNIKIDDVNLVAKITPDFDASSATVELGTKLAAGSHPIAISGYTDMVGFVAPAFTGVLNVVADTTAPSLVSVTTVDRDTVTLNFDEPVATLGTITIDTYAISSPVASSDLKSYTVNIATPLSISSLVLSTVSYVGTADIEGNTVSTAKTLTFAMTDDTTAPTVAVSITTANKVQLVFSESVSTIGTITVKNSSGSTVTDHGSFSQDTTTDSTGKTYVSANAVAATAGAYTITVADSKDNSVRLNTITSTVTSASTYDLTAPTISTVLLKTAYAASPLVYGQATVYFSEAMDVSTITNLQNYLVDLDGAGNGTVVSLSTITGAAAVASADGKSVVLTIPGSTFAAGAAAASGVTNIYVLAVKDVAGNLINTSYFNVAKFVDSAADDFTITAAEASAVNAIKVTFSSAIATINPSEFKVYKNDGTTLAFVGISAAIDSTNPAIATITLNGSMTTDAEAVDGNGAAKLAIASAAYTANAYGKVVSNYSATALVDKIAPVVSTLATGTVTGQIVLTLSEAVYASEANLEADLIIKDSTGAVIDPTKTYSKAGTSVAAADIGTTGFDKIVITGLTSGSTYTIELISRYVVDGNSNKIAAKAATAVAAY